MTKASQAREEFTGNVSIERDVAGRLYDIGLALTSDIDLQQVLQRVLESAVSMVDAEIATLYMYSAELDQLGLDPFQLVAAIGTSKPAPHYPPPQRKRLTDLVVRTKEPIVSNDARQDPVFKDSPFIQDEEVDSIAGIPLIKGYETVGVLYFSYHKPDQITQDRLRAMQLFANQAAIAIANARLFEEIREREKILRRLTEVGYYIREVSGEGLRGVLLHIVKIVCELTDADCAVLYPYDRSRPMFYDISNVVSYGVLHNFRLSDKPRLGGMAAFVGRAGMIVVNDIEREDPAMLSSPFIMREGIRAFMGVSLTVGDSVVGVLYVNHRRPHLFDEDERGVIEILGNMAALVIRNSWHIQTLQELRESQEQRLAVERWATLGKAVTNLAHRINNTAALVPVAVQDLKELLAELPMAGKIREQVDGDLSRIERNTRFTVELADGLLKPFKGGPTQRLDVNALLGEAVALSALPDTVKLVMILSPDLPAITTSSLLVDVFVELISNAVKAMPHDGRLEIGTRLAPDDQVEIWVSDTGMGISPEHQEKVFDLFFTTREDRLGFGLWWVKNFLLQQGGTIVLKSKVGRGTTFTIRLPVRRVESAAVPSETKQQEV